MGVDGFRFDLAAVLGNTCTVGSYIRRPTARTADTTSTQPIRTSR
jgi:pullulanase/glycogen debranching enzyme